MSYAEALQWQAFLEKRGTVHLGMRLEAGFALIAATINRALGGKAKIEDFMPHAREAAETDEPTVENVLRELMKGYSPNAKPPPKKRKAKVK